MPSIPKRVLGQQDILATAANADDLGYPIAHEDEAATDSSETTIYDVIVSKAIALRDSMHQAEAKSEREHPVYSDKRSYTKRARSEAATLHQLINQVQNLIDPDRRTSSDITQINSHWFTSEAQYWELRRQLGLSPDD